MHPRSLLSLPLALMLALAVSASAVAAPKLKQFPIPTSNLGPGGIVAGPDGNLWFAVTRKQNGVGRITPTGTVSEFSEGFSGKTQSLAVGNDGNLWVTEPAAATIARVTTLGVVTEYGVEGAPAEITAGPDGALWFTEPGGSGAIGRITTGGAPARYTAGLTASSAPLGIAAGADGALWFTESANPGRIGRISTTGSITEYSAGLTANRKPTGITAGPDGALWFTESANPGAIGRIDPSTGAITEFTAGLTPNSHPTAITAAGDGNLHFTEAEGNKIGMITPAGSISEITVPEEGLQPIGAAEGPDGNLWLTQPADPGGIARLSVAPGVVTGEAGGLHEQGALLNARIRGNAQNPTEYSFEYGTTVAYGIHTGKVLCAGACEGAGRSNVSIAVTGLSPGTQYHFRAVASNPTGTTLGADQSFTTAASPTAQTLAATARTTSTAMLQGSITPADRAATYHFDWGTTTAYGSHIPQLDAAAGSDHSTHAVELALEGLSPSVTYHYRLVASDCGGCAEGTTYGQDQSFTTRAPATPLESPFMPGLPGASPQPAPTQPTPTPPTPPAPPLIGRTALAGAVSGIVLVRSPGATAMQSLTAARDIPIGSLIDTSHGVVQLGTAVDDARRVQTATAWGGSFVLTQTRTRHGLTTFTLAGPLRCTSMRGRRLHALAARSGRGPTRSLWATDNHGSFSTRGMNSVATVRGTYWVTVDRCDGTLTIVRRGAVSVHGARGRTVLVRAGHSYLARP